MEEDSVASKRKTLVQTKLNFSKALCNSSTEKRTQKDNFTSFVKAKQVTKPNQTQNNRKIPTLQKLLEDPNLEKIDNRHVYCHYCETEKPIILHRINDGYRLWQHLETIMHKDNVMHEQTNPSKKRRTTFLHFEKEQRILNRDTHSKSSEKVCHGYYSRSFSTLARYGTSTTNYKILRDDDLFDRNVKAHGYIQSDKCEGYTTFKYCPPCSNLAQLESVQKRNQRYQELIAQIDSLFALKEGQSIPASFISQFGNTWTQYDIKKLYGTIIVSLKNRPGNTKSTELQQLQKYIEKEMKDHSYYMLVAKYPALGRIVEAVEMHGIDNWIGQCMTFLIDKTMEEKRPIFVGMAQAVTKVIDKLQRGVTSMRGIGEYHESFIDFLIVLMSISTLATRWLTANLAGPTIRFLRHKRNESDTDYNIYGINTSSFPDIIRMWRKAYNYAGPTVCAKDQTKVAELIEVCRRRQKWIGCVPIDDTAIPTTMTIEELHNKISNFKKATYITVYALSACVPGIPPVVIAVIPSDQTEKAEINTNDNNLIMKELNCAGAMTIGLYFDGATLDRNWLGEVYCKNPAFSQELALVQFNGIGLINFPITLHMTNNSLPFICGTDIYHCVKKGRNMHNSGTRICPIGHYVMSTEHLWILKENSEIYSGLTNDILNPKDKQADESAERFFSSSVLKGLTDYAIKNNSDDMYGDACYHFFCGILFESWKSHDMTHIDRIGFAWSACIFFAGIRKFLKENPATRNGNKFGISWQSCDDFIYLGLTLILLIQNWPNFYSDYPLCPWMLSTAFLEHIFGYARRIIEDFTVLDFLLMNEKILKTIMIEMKGDLIRPDNNDGYNIKLTTAKENLPENLSNFPSIFEIDNMIKKTSKAMKNILYSLGIQVNQDFSALIKQSLHSLKKETNSPLEEITDSDDELDEEMETGLGLDESCDIDELLARHQKRILNRSNLPEKLNFSNDDLDENNENTQLASELVLEEDFFENINRIFEKTHKIDPLTIMEIMSDYREKYDHYTQKEKRKIRNKVTRNENNLIVITESGTMDIMAAVRQDRLSNTEKQTRTKGRITRWKTACKKVFDSIKINPQSSKFKRGDFYYYCESSHSIVIAEIIAVFEKRGSSYVRVDLFYGSNEGRIHARLYDLKPESENEFIPIISQNRTQFICESNPFRFITYLGSVLEEYNGTSRWLGKTVKLGDLQYATYSHFIGKSHELEQSIREAEKIMRAKKNNSNDND